MVIEESFDIYYGSNEVIIYSMNYIIRHIDRFEFI